MQSSRQHEPGDYVGEYVFSPPNSDPGEFASFIMLRRDHSTVEVHFYPATGEVSTTKNKWAVYRTTGENISIGKREYPIRPSESHIKRLINDDLGQYYEKVR